MPEEKGIVDLLSQIDSLKVGEIDKEIKEKEAELETLKATIGKLRSLKAVVQTKTAKTPRKRKPRKPAECVDVDKDGNVPDDETEAESEQETGPEAE